MGWLPERGDSDADSPNPLSVLADRAILFVNISGNHLSSVWSFVFDAFALRARFRWHSISCRGFRGNSQQEIGYGKETPCVVAPPPFSYRPPPFSFLFSVSARGPGGLC